MKLYWIIWAAFVIAVFHYPVIAVFAFPTSAEGASPLFLTYIFALLGLLCGIASVFVWLKLVRAPHSEGKLKINLNQTPQKLHANFVIAWALAESPAVLGFAANVVETTPYTPAIFAGVSLLIFLFETPAFLNEEV